MEKEVLKYNINMDKRFFPQLLQTFFYILKISRVIYMKIYFPLDGFALRVWIFATNAYLSVRISKHLCFAHCKLYSTW